MGLESFKASDTWLYNFKQRNRIVTRKITKLLSRRDVANLPNVSTNINQYRLETRDLIGNYAPNQIFNTDQSGFNVELLSGRTLTNKGEKSVFSTINQSRSHTHSYTIQPLFRMDGVLAPQLLIVLQEKDGVLGPIVSRDLFTHPEIYIKATTSGKVGKQILQEWFADIFFPQIEHEAVLILDSLSTYKNKAYFDQVKPNTVSYHFSIIPPGLTPSCQPLDVYFFRLYKAMIRRISDYINFNRPEIKLHIRNTILKLQACVYFQFRSPRFIDCRRYAWYKSGLLEDFDRSIRFPDPNKYCFPENILTRKCASQSCPKICYIQCSWCQKSLCFDHFFSTKLHINDNEFLKFHYCNNYV